MSLQQNDEGADALSVIRSLYQRVAAKDFEGVLGLMSDEVLVTQAASLPFGGTWRGKPAFLEMAGRIVAAWPGFAVEPVSYLADGQGRVVVFARLTGQGLDMDMLEMWEVREGLVVTCQPFYFDTAAASAGAAARAA